MEKLIENQFYHIYNRGNNREDIFFTDANYAYFLEKFLYHCGHVFDVYSFCFLVNHFHFLVKVRSLEEQLDILDFQSDGKRKLKEPHQHLSNFFNSYSKSINVQENRVGSLFQKPYKRKLIQDDDYFRRLVVYIHQNPMKHGLIVNFREYLYSSYCHYINSSDTIVSRKWTLDLFGGLEKFIECHSLPINEPGRPIQPARSQLPTDL